jgi:hypothetical protein
VTVSAVRFALTTALLTVDGISRAYGYAPDSLQPPCAFVGTITYNPHASFDEADLTAQVWVAVSGAASSQRAVETLDGFIDGANPVPTALEAANAAWDSLAVTGAEFPVTITVGAGEYVAARFDCEVML